MKRSILTLFIVTIWAATQAQPAFTPGNVAVLRVGTTGQTLTNSGNSIFIDQFTPGGVLVGSIPVPDSGAAALLLSGTASSEGGMTRAADRTVLTFGAYNTNRAAVSGSLANSTATPRGVATVDASGSVILQQAATNIIYGNNIRCAATDGTNNFWAAGGAGGILYLTPPSTLFTNEIALANNRFVKAIGGNLYFSFAAGSTFPYGVYYLSGLPRTSTATTNVLFLTGSGSAPGAFDLSPDDTVAYVADSRSVSPGGVQKWTNNGTAWSLAYSFGLGTGAGFGAFGVVADWSGTTPVIYATTTEASSNRLVCIVDTNASAVVTTLASTGTTNTWFRGVELAPDLRPLITSQPQNQTMTNGGAVTFTVGATSPFAFTYQWLTNGAALNGANNASLELSNVGLTNQAAYSVIVSNQYGAVTSRVATLTVTVVATPPAITSQPASVGVLQGGNAQFHVAVSGTAPFGYHWQFASNDLTDSDKYSGVLTDTLTVSNVQPADAGNYSAIVTNSAGTTNSQTAALTVILYGGISYVGYTNAASNYTQNFDSLPNPGAISSNAANPVTINGTIYSVGNPFDFAAATASTGSGGLGLGATMSGWFGSAATAMKLGASAGDQTTGGDISFGLTNGVTSNRALGLLATSTSGGTAFGLRLINFSGQTLNQISLSFTGELWRQQTTAKTIQFSYYIDPTAAASFPAGATAAITNLNVAFATGASSPVDGTQPANQTSLGVSNYAITNWPSGAALWLVWRMTNSAGSAQGLAIDNLSFSASAPGTIVLTSLSIAPSGTNAVITWPAAATGYALQANADLGVTDNWSSVTQSVIQLNGSNTVTVPITATNQFFRLKQ